MEIPRTFSIIDGALSYGWNAFKKNPVVIVYFLASIVIPVLLSLVVNLPISLIFGEEDIVGSIISFVFNVVLQIISYIFAMGMIRVQLNIFEGKPLKFENLYQDYGIVGKYFLANLCLGFAMAIALIPAIIALLLGAMLLRDYIIIFALIAIVNAIFVMYMVMRWSMWTYVLVDQHAGPIQSLNQSWKITKGNVLKLLVFYLLQSTIVILGLLLLVVGIFAAIPLTSLMMVYVYKTLAGSTKQSAPAVAPVSPDSTGGGLTPPQAVPGV